MYASVLLQGIHANGTILGRQVHSKVHSKVYRKYIEKHTAKYTEKYSAKYITKHTAKSTAKHIAKYTAKYLWNSVAIHFISSSRNSWWLFCCLGSCHAFSYSSFLCWWMRSRCCGQVRATLQKEQGTAGC